MRVDGLQLCAGKLPRGVTCARHGVVEMRSCFRPLRNEHFPEAGVTHLVEEMASRTAAMAAGRWRDGLRYGLRESVGK
jgi:hypothetical protein